ncbi:MAG: TolC family protein [Selenomonadaceae bacterium]|nr:TolC family protein [Selenomonadaceae bacterium]
MKKSILNKVKAITAGAVIAPFIFGVTSITEAAELSIQQAVDMALAQNTDLAITATGEKSARADLKAARGRNSITISGKGNLGLNKKNTDDEQTRSGSASASVSFPLFTAGKNEANISSGKLGVKIARLETERARENTRLKVIQSYYDVLEWKQTVDVGNQSVNSYRAHLTNVQQLFAAGSKAKIDVLRSEVELSNAEQDLIRAQNKYAISIKQLKTLLGLPQDEELVLTEDFNYVVFTPELETCLSYALENRKDIVVDQYKVKQQKYAIRSAKADYYPHITVSAGIGGNERYQPRPHTSGSNYEAGVSASWNIFDGGVTHAAVEKARAGYEKAELTLKRDLENADLSFQTAYLDMREAEKRLRTTQVAVTRAQEDYYIATEKYKAGEGLMLDVLDAQVALVTAQLNDISAKYDYSRGRAAVEYEMGLSLGETAEEALARQAEELAEKAAQEKAKEAEEHEQ